MANHGSPKMTPKMTHLTTASNHNEPSYKSCNINALQRRKKIKVTTMSNHDGPKIGGSKMTLTTTSNHDRAFVMPDISTDYGGVILSANHDS